MSGPWKKFELSEELLAGLEKKTARKEEIFSFRSDPLLAALISCLGLQFELGKPDQDRISFLLGVDLSKYEGNPWRTEIVTLGDQIGLRAWVPGLKEFRPMHEDFRFLFHPLSISQEGNLDQLLLFPNLVAEAYRAKGIELVVVRDWALSAFLSREKNLNYQKTNKQEIEENIALTQVRLMRNRQLALTGTHDIADHLLGGHAAGLELSHPLLDELAPVYNKAFTDTKATRRSLVLSYLIAVVLDDLAQPQWYASEAHLRVARRACRHLQASLGAEDIAQIFLPQAFHELVTAFRNRSSTSMELDALSAKFELELQGGVFKVNCSTIRQAGYEVSLQPSGFIRV